MTDPIETAIQEARRERALGKAEEAELAYVRAVDLARSAGDEVLLAHALRHVSDLERERGARREAWEHASEAAALYRKSGEKLGLANAIRLEALSSQDCDEEQACWREARDLYSALGVSAGVAECDRRLCSEPRGS